MGSGGGGGQSAEQKETELLNQQNLLLQQKQAKLQDKRLAEEGYQADLSEWEAENLLQAKRASGSARRTGGSIFDKSEGIVKPEEPDYSIYDKEMADLDAQIEALKKKQEETSKPSKPSGGSNSNSSPNGPIGGAGSSQGGGGGPGQGGGSR